MSIIEKVFHYEESAISVIKCKDDIWFRGKDIAKVFGYSIPRKAIRERVDPKDRSSLESLQASLTKGGLKWTPLTNEQKSAIFINESGLYSIVLQSKLESAKAFKRWVTKDVLPSIRKTGRYDHKYNNMLTFKIENETDLHVKVVHFLKKRYPHSLFTVTLGENQDTVYKRIIPLRRDTFVFLQI